MLTLPLFSPGSLVAPLVGLGFVYCVVLVLYRLYFSPIARFPGSKIAAATLWTEFYYDAIKPGQFQFKIREWHEKYGPIVRINPYELHVDDPTGDFYGVVFSHSGIRDKHPFYTAQFGTGSTGFGTVSHEQHRVRRRAMNPFFQYGNILRFEPVIREKLNKLCRRIDEYRASGLGAMPMRIVYMSYATDVITSFAFNYSWDHLDSSDFNPWWWQTTQSTAAMTKWTKQFPWLLPTLQSLPDSFVAALNPSLGLKLRKIAEEIFAGRDEKYAYYSDGSPRTLFHELLKSDLPAQDKSVNYLWQEGQNVIGAGADTVALALSTTTYYLLANPEKANKLRKELATAQIGRETPLSLVELQQLPYLNGVINEGLRFSYGTSCRLTRTAPSQTLKFQDWTIPQGTPISMSSLMQHHNENIFPNSHSFIPERWSEREDGGKGLDKYMVSFSKGSRQCIGMGFAKAELYLTIATIFSRYPNMELFDTDFDRDIKMVSDMFFPQPSKESRGIRVLFKD
ncbi:hypothetical protein HYFRA_00007087 [Hymenoscyphus fraxineus]|uniref:Cytochrome P450 n=1 Tax=Hymenoscyphus fraxineus TaxID=746836 RepID=A0A9N9PTZ7_9HELO|nr:hypothetical protein HYFRA_00007087 [Hymenoscyphus fraxineus]